MENQTNNNNLSSGTDVPPLTPRTVRLNISSDDQPLPNLLTINKLTIAVNKIKITIYTVS